MNPPLNKIWFAFKYLRMTLERFENLLDVVGPLIQKKQTCRSRQPISPEQRLVITLRYYHQSQSSVNFTVRGATVCKIVTESDTCSRIWLPLKDKFLKSPETTFSAMENITI